MIDALFHYLDEVFERFAADENTALKTDLERQARAYRPLAAIQAEDMGSTRT